MIINESNTKDWEELAKFMANEMDSEELMKFNDRLDKSDNNKKLVQQVKSDWENMKNYKNDKEFDTDKAWERLHSKFENDGLLDNIKETGRKNNYSLLVRIAAIFILGILVTSIAYYLLNDTQKTNWQIAETYKNKDNLKVELADGSIVYLNANSKLYYPEKFSEKSRVVEFDGDAFFEIAKNPQRPFIIKAKGAEIKVLGTSFNVNTNIESKELEVLVETGKVKLSSMENEKNYVTLVPGEMGTLKGKNVSQHKNTDKNYLSWKTKYFVFNEGIKLGEAIKILNRAYHTEIKCANDQICEKVLNSTHNNESLETVLKIICDPYSLKIKKEDGIIILTDK
jgi:transmembrane sensor